MAEGVTFTDGDQVSAQMQNTWPGSIGSAGGPLDTPTDEGRSSDVVVGNNENMPTRGNVLESPCD